MLRANLLQEVAMTVTA